MSEAEWSLKELVDNINRTLEIDKDFPMIIDGLTGAGKSTLAIHLAKKGCSWFKIDEDVIFSRDELIDKIMKAPKLSYIVLDEAINVLFKRDFMNKQQKFILRLLDMCRDRNLCLILCVPNFWSIDKHILEGRIRLRIHIAKTGFGFMWKPTSNPFTPDKWCRKYNETISYNWDNYPNAKKTKGFIGYIKFGDLADADRAVYLKVKETKKEEIRQKEEEEENKQEKDKEKGFLLGETAVLGMLRDQGLLKYGALSIYASMKGESAKTIDERIKRYKQKEKEEGKLSNFNYINDTKSKIIDENPSSIQHTAL